MNKCYIDSVLEPMATCAQNQNVLEHTQDLLDEIYKWDGCSIDEILGMIEYYNSECSYFEENRGCVLDSIDYSKISTTKFKIYIDALNKEK